MSATQIAHGRMPQSERSMASAQGHWVLARLGKRVLRPGGLGLTRAMLANARLRDADVVELAPGLGRTARMILDAHPRSYVGVDRDQRAVELVRSVLGDRGECRVGVANATGLASGAADVVVGEAMLSMQTDGQKRDIVREAARLLRPGGRYVIHELALQPDNLHELTKQDIRIELARALRVNARPLTVSEWSDVLRDAGLEVEWVQTAPMALLKLSRNIADEGLWRTAAIIVRALRDPAARSRVLAMRAVFRRHRQHLGGMAIVARRPTQSAGD